MSNGYSSIFGGFETQRQQLASRRTELRTEQERATAEKERLRRETAGLRRRVPTRQFIDRDVWAEERQLKLGKRKEALRLETQEVPKIELYETKLVSYGKELDVAGTKLAAQEAEIRSYQAAGYKVRPIGDKYQFYKEVITTPEAPPKTVVVGDVKYRGGYDVEEIRHKIGEPPDVKFSGIDQIQAGVQGFDVLTARDIVSGAWITSPTQLPVSMWSPAMKEKYLQPKMEPVYGGYRLKNIFGETTVTKIKAPETAKTITYQIESVPKIYTPEGYEYGKPTGRQYVTIPKSKLDPLYWTKQEFKKIDVAYSISPVLGGVAEYGFGAVSTFASLGKPIAEYAAGKFGYETRPVHYVSPIDVAFEPFGLAPTGTTKLLEERPIFAAGGIAGEVLQTYGMTKGIGYAGKGIKIGATKAWGGALRYTGTKPIDIFWGKTRALGKIQKFAVGRGLYDPTKGTFSYRTYMAKSRALGRIKTFGYERGLIQPITKYPVSPIRWKFAKVTGRGLFRSAELTAPYPGYAAGKIRTRWELIPKTKDYGFTTRPTKISIMYKEPFKPALAKPGEIPAIRTTQGELYTSRQLLKEGGIAFKTDYGTMRYFKLPKVETKMVIGRQTGKQLTKQIVQTRSPVVQVGKIRFPTQMYVTPVADIAYIESLETGVAYSSKFWKGVAPVLGTAQRKVQAPVSIPLLDVRRTLKQTQAQEQRLKPRFETRLMDLTKPKFDVFEGLRQPEITITTPKQAQKQKQMMAQLLRMETVQVLEKPTRGETVRTYPPKPYVRKFKPKPIPPIQFPKEVRRKKKKKIEELYVKKYRFRMIELPDPLKGLL